MNENENTEKITGEKMLDSVESLRKKVAELEESLAAAKEKNLYLRAEVDNTRKMYQKQHGVVEKKTKVNIIAKFLPIIDSLESALNSSENILKNNSNPQIKTFFLGFYSLLENIAGIFENIGIKQIKEINVPFDYNYHEVVEKEERDDLPEDTVTQIVQPGYKLNGDVLRPAKVIVSKKIKKMNYLI